MKKAIYTLTIIAFSLSGKLDGQIKLIFPIDSAIWQITTFFHGPCENNCTNSNIYIMNKDTLINGMKYSKLYHVENNNFKYFGAFRQDTTKKVYYLGKIPDFDCISNYSDTTEIILYDFDLQIGDSIKNINFECAKGLVYDIDSIDYMGKRRKRYTIQRKNLLNDNYWIEGIGSTKGLFYPLKNEFEINWELTCFEEGVSDWEKSNCWPVTNIDNSKINKQNIIVYPNPLINESFIYLTENNFYPHIFSIIDLNGKVILSKTIENQSEIKILRNQFSKPGIYVISVRLNNVLINKKLCVL